MELKPEHPQSKEPAFCDRCGNVGLGKYSLWFPYKRIRIWLCGICNDGLLLGFYKDMAKFIKDTKYE